MEKNTKIVSLKPYLVLLENMKKDGEKKLNLMKNNMHKLMMKKKNSETKLDLMNHNMDKLMMKKKKKKVLIKPEPKKKKKDDDRKKIAIFINNYDEERKSTKEFIKKSNKRLRELDDEKTKQFILTKKIRTIVNDTKRFIHIYEQSTYEKNTLLIDQTKRLISDLYKPEMIQYANRCDLIFKEMITIKEKIHFQQPFWFIYECLNVYRKYRVLYKCGECETSTFFYNTDIVYCIFDIYIKRLITYSPFLKNSDIELLLDKLRKGNHDNEYDTKEKIFEPNDALSTIKNDQWRMIKSLLSNKVNMNQTTDLSNNDIIQKNNFSYVLVDDEHMYDSEDINDDITQSSLSSES